MGNLIPDSNTKVQSARKMRGLEVLPPVLLLFCSTHFTACSSLQKSQIDHHFRIEGSYLCNPHSVARPRQEKPDATVFHCYRDSLTVGERNISWKRVFFEDPDCFGGSIGFSEWTTRFQQGDQDHNILVRTAPALNTALTRIEPGWYYDSVGRCDLRQLPLHQKIKMRAACLGLYPKKLRASFELLFISRRKAAANELKGEWDSRMESCTR